MNKYKKLNSRVESELNEVMETETIEKNGLRHLKKIKKIILVGFLLIFTSVFCFGQAKIVHFDGMSFDSKGWFLQKAHRGIDGSYSISGQKGIIISRPFLISILKSKSDGIETLNYYMENLQKKMIDDYSSTKYSGKANIVKGNIEDTEVNGIKAKYFDLKYEFNAAILFYRTYIIEKGGYFITINTYSSVSFNTDFTKCIKKHNKNFAKILNSFRFEPE